MKRQIFFPEFSFFLFATITFLFHSAASEGEKSKSMPRDNNEATGIVAQQADEQKEEKFFVDMIKTNGLVVEEEVLAQLEYSEDRIQKMLRNGVEKDDECNNLLGCGETLPKKKKKGFKAKMLTACKKFRMNLQTTYKIMRSAFKGRVNDINVISKAMKQTLGNNAEMLEEFLKKECDGRKANGDELDVLIEDLTKSPAKVITKSAKLLYCSLGKGKCDETKSKTEMCRMVSTLGSAKFVERVEQSIIVVKERKHQKKGWLTQNPYFFFSRIKFKSFLPLK